MTRADGSEGRIILRTERTFLRKMSGGYEATAAILRDESAMPALRRAA